VIWRHVQSQPYGRPHWACETHWVLLYGRDYLLFARGTKGYVSTHESLAAAQRAAAHTRAEPSEPAAIATPELPGRLP